MAATGEEALEYLEGQLSSPEGQELPALILLDLGLPGISGFDVLARIQDDPALREIPVLVLTMSPDPEDAQRAFSLGARRFLQKPEDFTEVALMVRDLLPPWLEDG